MKAIPSNNQQRALTLIEVMVAAFSLCIMAIVLLSALSVPRVRTAIGCVNHLKQMGLAVRVWEGNNGDKYPASLATTNGMGVAENIFMTLSNELGNPRVLVCPADRHRVPASSFRTLTAKNISYFYNPEAREQNPQDIMVGDDNLTVRGVRVKSGLLTLTNVVPFGWTADRHRGCGNLGLADGSVQSATVSGLAAFLRNYTNELPSTNGFTLRLAIP